MSIRIRCSRRDLLLGFLWFHIVVCLTGVLTFIFNPASNYIYCYTGISEEVIDLIGGFLLFVLSIYLIWNSQDLYSDRKEIKNDLKQCGNFGPVRAIIGYIIILHAPLIILVSLIIALVMILQCF